MRVFPSRLTLGLCAMLCGCSDPEPTRTSNSADAVNGASAEAPAAIALPKIAPVLDRRDMLLLVADAASAFAIGRDDAETQRALSGRAFTFRLRLCNAVAASFRSSFDPATRVLKVEASPDLVRPSITETGQQGMIEGFLVPHPWLLEAGCPRPAAVSESAEADPSVAGRSRVAVAQFLPAGSARSAQRKDRPYEVTRKLTADVDPQPIDLVFQGRLREPPGGKVIGCSGGTSQRPPDCTIFARIDTVRFEQAGGETLAVWTSN